MGTHDGDSHGEEDFAALLAESLSQDNVKEGEILRVTGLQPAPRLASVPRPAPSATNGKR